MLSVNNIGGAAFNFPKPPQPVPARPTGDATNDQILKRLHAIEHQLIKNMHHTEAVVQAAVEHILKAIKANHK